MKGTFPIDRFKNIRTPFYYYDTALLQQTLDVIKAETARHKGYKVHYAVKANTNPKLLDIINKAGLGADCVSGGEIEAAIKAGFPTNEIVYAHTHANITTGLAENKFGIALEDLLPTIEKASAMKNVSFIGLHFHIGSQILDMGDFEALCAKINEIQDSLEAKGIVVENINVGGGLGISYDDPNGEPIPNFKAYFDTYAQNLKLREHQTLHFELGRAVVGQCGSLITKTLYIKQGTHKQFAIVDAGMTDLIRPALYQAYHKIENLSSNEPVETYDVVGPICESSDVFAKGIEINRCHRGDIIALRSAGAYGEIMASQYNCRQLPKGYVTTDL